MVTSSSVGTYQMRCAGFPETVILHLKRFEDDASGSSLAGNQTRVDFPTERLAFGSVCNCTDNPKPEYDLMSVIQYITKVGQTGGHFVTIARHAVDQAWQLFDDSTVRAPNASDWCSTRVYVMVYQRNVIEGLGIPQVNEKNDGVCTEHKVVGGVLQRHCDVVNDYEVDTCDDTDMRGRPQTQHSVAAGMLLHDLHTAIVQIDGKDEMATNITMQYDTIPTVSSELENLRGDNDETPHDTTGVSEEDVGQSDTHQVRERGAHPSTSN